MCSFSILGENFSSFIFGMCIFEGGLVSGVRQY
jgi:hypothetical protein